MFAGFPNQSPLLTTVSGTGNLKNSEFFSGLSLRAGGRGFSPVTKRVAPGYFYWKMKKNRTKRNP